MHFMPTRRGFLKNVAATFVSLIVPTGLRTRRRESSFWFIHADTGACWEVADPAQWAIANARLPVLERASEGLLKLTPDDGDRIIRLVVRRCGLNLLEILRERVGVHHWGLRGLADLRPFFKTHRLAIPEIEIVLRDCKKEVATTQHGDDFLYGDRLAADWPLDLYLMKWRGRFLDQPDDWTAAPGTWSGYAWAGLDSNQIPWAALKSAWRHGQAIPCRNCDGPTILVNFGEPWPGLFRRSPRFVYVCRACQRSFLDDSARDVGAWLDLHLDAQVRPGFVMVWDCLSARNHLQ